MSWWYNRSVSTLEHLRQRPKDEKTAIAASVAIGVVAILFIGWLVYFFHSIESAPAPDLQSVTSSSENGLQEASQQFQQSLGSTTQFINIEGNAELQPVSTSTNSSQ